MAGSRKPNKSFSLSRESVAFLEKLRKKHRARSVSSVLEDLVREARRQEQLRVLEKQAEERAWAAIGSQELAARDFGPPT